MALNQAPVDDPLSPQDKSTVNSMLTVKAPSWRTWLTNLRAAVNQWPASGPTSGRPVNPSVGFPYFDTTLGIQVWWNGAAWVSPGLDNGRAWDQTLSSAQQTITSPTLSGNADGGYEFEWWIFNNTASNVHFYMYVNGDAYAQDSGYEAYVTGIFGSLVATGEIFYMAPAYSLGIRGSMQISPNGQLFASFSYSYTVNSSGAVVLMSTACQWMRKATVADITSITIYADVALGIGVNSRFRAWRRNPKGQLWTIS